MANDEILDDSQNTPTVSTLGFPAVYVLLDYDFYSGHGAEARVEYSVDGGPWMLARSLIYSDLIGNHDSVLLPGAGAAGGG